jgi:hypothetical protein
MQETWGSQLHQIASKYEIVDSPLWFSGYTIYKTAFCKKWLANIIFDPTFTPNSSSYLYSKLLYDWELHHIMQTSYQPVPPSRKQFEDAIKYFYAKNILTDPLNPPKKPKHPFFDFSLSPIVKALLP